MGDNRRQEIVRHGGKPVDFTKMSDSEIMDASLAAHRESGTPHPLVDRAIKKKIAEETENGGK